MPSQTPTSFASAAAGGMSQDWNARGSGRADASGAMDWSRPRTNGAGTATFRRPSQVTSQSHSSATPSAQTHTLHPGSTPGAYMPPHYHQSHSLLDTRFSKDTLVNLYKSQKDAGQLGKNLSDLFAGDWQPGSSTIHSTAPSIWSRKDDGAKENPSGADICWDVNGAIAPLALMDMTDSEKEHFSTSVNSSLNPPQQGSAKDQGGPGSAVTRKTSVSHALNTGLSFGLPTQSSVRSSGRFKDAHDSEFVDHSLSSPTTGPSRHMKEDSNVQAPPPSLVRRRTEGRDNVMSTPAPDRERDLGLRQGSLDTSTALANTPSRNVIVGPGPTTLPQTSPWTNTGSTFSPMGSFGNLSSTDPLSHPSGPADRKPGLGSTRSTSRWSKIINRGSPEDHGVTEKLSVGNLGKLSEADAESSPRDWSETRVNRPVSNDTDPYGDRDRPEGPSALEGMLDMGPSHLRQASRMSTPGAPESKDGLGLADVTTNPSVLTGLREVLSDRSNQPPLRAAPPPPVYGDGEPLSPTETNPYQSPVPEKADPEDVDTDGSDVRHVQHQGLNDRVPNEAINNHYSAASEMEVMSQMPTSFDHPPNERAPAYRATPDHLFTTGLSTMGGTPRAGGPAGWPTGSALLNGLGSEQTPFGSECGLPVYHAVNELQPSTFGAPTTGLPGSAYNDGGAGTRGGRLGSMFPPAMYTPQMLGVETIKSPYDLETSHHLHGLPPRSTATDQQQQQQQQQQPPSRMASANYGSAFPSTGQDPGSPMRAARGLFDNLLPSNIDNGRHRGSTDRPLTGSDSSVRVSTSASGQESLSTLLAATSNTAVASAVAPSNNNNNHHHNNPTQPSARASQVTTGASQPSAQPPPPSQQRIMVMPDRMRWIYRDPQGAVQGPWSGLEMHDWFKAGFFSAELLVRKFEDAEFEPLGQLIRRIGNSREPFLVPQIGIPHGPPSNQTGGPWNNGAGTSASNQTSPTGPVQPPFAGAFPSFGTTLTAEQQNALERRKQEEQFLMARQKEYLAQQQLLQKQMQQIHGVHQQLHHHSSAHSLHSQPSFGSMTSPSAFHPTPPQGPIQPPQPVPNFFDNHARLGGPAFLGPMGLGNDFAVTGPGSIRDEELAALLARQSLGRDGPPPPHGFSTSSNFHQQHPENQGHPSQVAAMIAQRAQLQREQAKHDSMLVPSSDEQQAPNYRLQEFNQLRAHLEDHVRRDDGNVGESLDHSTTQADTTEDLQRHLQQPAGYSLAAQPEDKTNVTKKILPRDAVPFSASKQQQQNHHHHHHQYQQTPEVLSLTEQVQKAASEQQQPTISSQPESGWGRGETPGLPRPFPPAPPPQSISPLPAPAAQRNRQQLPEALAIEHEARLRSQTSSVETPSAISSIAPWAKEVPDGPKGPSLKEIQEAEARKVAKAEEMALAARRTFLEQERDRLNQQATANPALLQGLPPSSTWGSGTPPLTPTGVGPSAWVKPLATKTNVESSIKKTLSQIQAEEEARKQKAAGAANTVNPASSNVVSGVTGVTTGKRYADLASKAAPSLAAGTGGGAWTTVGATGKAKAQPQSSIGLVSGITRVASAGSTGSGNATGNKARANVQPPRPSAVVGGVSAVHNAQEEFSRWAKVTLSKRLDPNINVDDFVQQLLMFPAEAEIISESVYANSQTMDGRQFAVEFLRRRKQAEKGVGDASAPNIHNSSGAGYHYSSNVLTTGRGGVSTLTGGVAGSSNTNNHHTVSGGGWTSGNKNSTGGWNEVAKKNPPPAKEPESASSAFKVVATKRKGKR